MTNSDVSIVPVLVHDDEIANLYQACEFTGLSADTIRRWNKRYLIARPSRGNAPLKIHKPALSMLMHGDFQALELLRRGNYLDWRVARHYEFAGVPVPAIQVRDAS